MTASIPSAEIQQAVDTFRVLDTTRNGILILHAVTGQVVETNPLLSELLGYSQEEIRALKLWEIGPFKDESPSSNIFDEVQMNDYLHLENVLLETKDGRQIEVEFVSNSYCVEGTRFIRCQIRDLTDRTPQEQALDTALKELVFESLGKNRRANERNQLDKDETVPEEERRKAVDELLLINADLARSNADLKQFAYVATHELQEPLRTVASYVQLLQKRCGGQLDERARELITHAVDGTTRMQTLINDLLGYSLLGIHAKAFVHIDCDKVLNDALANLAVAIDESAAEVTREPLPTVSADPTQLTRLFQNLIGNALKFRGALPAKIHVSAALQDGAWRISIADNGIGLEPQHFERVFLVFQRLHTQRVYRGTGIGLAICKKIVERHGGRIWVESQTGQGATFHFTLPELK